MKASVLLIIICSVFFGLTAVEAADLRGRVDGVNPYASAPFPLAKAQVELKRQGNVQTLVASYRTGRDGMYYFRSVQPGQYVLIVNQRLEVPIRVNATSLQDVGPILFRY